MKKMLKLICIILCMFMLLPCVSYGYAASVEQNTDVIMPKISPAIDGIIDDGVYSEAAYFNDATQGRFWSFNAPVSTAEIFFAYDDSGLYFAADITDCHPDNGFVASTGYDNINNNGSKRPYGFNGDVMNLMLDPMGVYEKSSYQTTAWYNIGIFADNTVKVYRSQVNEGDITSTVNAAGVITETGWQFEVMIPWSVIVNDVKSMTSSKLSVTQAQLTAIGSVSRAACMYMDRYTTAAGVTDTWGRFITVCESTYDGYNGTHTNGVVAKAYGLILRHGDIGHVWGEWQTISLPTCAEQGTDISYCSHCGVSRTRATAAFGHIPGDAVITEAGCLTDGSETVYCSVCGDALESVILPAQGHSIGEWYTVAQPTADAHGIQQRDCDRCDYYETKVLPSDFIPYLTADNYDVSVTLADEIKDMRFAPGVYTKPSEIKTAAGNVAIDNATITKNTVDRIYSYEMPREGVYTFWIRMKNGSEYILPLEIKDIKTTLSAYGVKLSINDIRGDIKDLFIAKGEYETYSEIKAAGYIVNVTSVKIAGRHDYTYTVYEDGVHTVLLRYNDGSTEALHIDLSVDKPVFTENGLQMIISNLPDVKVIRTAYGTWSTVKELKATDTIRNFSAKTAIKGKDPYTIQYRNEGNVTVIVEYNNGYVSVYHYNVHAKKPVATQVRGGMMFSNLDGMVNLRYAPGRYTTSAQIKASPDSVVLKGTDIADDGSIRITGLEQGTVYTFCVQYDDDSYNYYVITVQAGFEEIIDIGDVRQLMVDDYIIDTQESDVVLKEGVYTKKNAVFTFNKAYENEGIVLPNIVDMHDGTYRMYYTAASGRRRICYITSTDGINWSRPNLRYNTYTGESYTNLVTSEAVSPAALYVFYDTNPNATERIKGIYGQWGDGLFLEHTKHNGDYFEFWPDETKMMGKPGESGGCYYDTLNTVYWDDIKQKYISFVRGFHWQGDYNLSVDHVENHPDKIIRDTRYAESDDCINWTTPVPINYNDGIDYQMYTNAIMPYHRSPGLYVGLPTRFVMDQSGVKWTDVFFMSSRDLMNWERSAEPVLAPAEGQMYEYPHGGYPCTGYMQTGEDELSFYMDEYSVSAGCDVLYRYTMRTDGFRYASGTTLVTKPVAYDGTGLTVNYQGSIRVTMTDSNGNSVQSPWLDGDEIDGQITFDGALDTNEVILTFEMSGFTKLYSFKFN